MVLIAGFTNDYDQPCSLAFKVDVPVTDEDLRRLVAIQKYVPGATWTGREGGETR